MKIDTLNLYDIEAKVAEAIDADVLFNQLSSTYFGKPVKIYRNRCVLLDQNTLPDAPRLTIFSLNKGSEDNGRDYFIEFELVIPFDIVPLINSNITYYKSPEYLELLSNAALISVNKMLNCYMFGNKKISLGAFSLLLGELGEDRTISSLTTMRLESKIYL